MQEKDYAAEYLALKAANDQLRERGKQWLFDTLTQLCAEANRTLVTQPDQPGIQTGIQEWQFKVENATMAGERFGARYRYQTLTVEVGWPRLPEHGFLTDNALARARVSLSQNTMLQPQTIAELVFKRIGGSEPVWFSKENNALGDQITATRMHDYLHLILTD
ncbi:MAG: hypothetical protein JST85_06245 [Acidobacteria bacterium]|nr:hypothetical protein [Acidobacteriota bacterium]